MRRSDDHDLPFLSDRDPWVLSCTRASSAFSCSLCGPSVLLQMRGDLPSVQAEGLRAAVDLADELSGLARAHDRESLKKSLHDLIRETPRTRVAETAIQKDHAEGWKRRLRKYAVTPHGHRERGRPCKTLFAGTRYHTTGHRTHGEIPEDRKFRLRLTVCSHCLADLRGTWENERMQRETRRLAVSTAFWWNAISGLDERAGVGDPRRLAPVARALLSRDHPPTK